MDSTNLTIMLSIVVLVCLSAFFSATETAYSSLNKMRLKSIANKGGKNAALALKHSENFDKILSTILIGNNIVNIMSASLATVVFVSFFGQKGVTLSTVFMTVIVLIFGEISPKSIAKESPERFAVAVAPTLSVFMFLLSPLNWLFGLWKKLLSQVIKAEKRPSITEEELITIVEEAENDGGIDENESELIRSAIEFNDLDVEEILTPRVDVVGIEQRDTFETIKDTFSTTGYSRLPVYDDTIDRIIGVIHEKDFYALINSGKNNLDFIISPAVCVTAQMKISTLLRKLQQTKSHMAVVVDEYGGTLGIVTLEDIIEELVGEIWDEHDEVIEYFTQKGEDEYAISCNADLSELFERFDVDGDASAYETVSVSGWVIHELGGIPEVGDSFTYKNLHITVTKTDYRRVLEVAVRVLPKEEQPEQQKE